ncbi:Multidrug resistance protein 1 [Sarracenia purpurea var. burkii]
MSQDSQGLKTNEEWRWSEMQGLELVSAQSDTHFNPNPSPPTTIITPPFQALEEREELGGESDNIREMEVSQVKKNKKKKKNDGGDAAEKPGSAPPSPPSTGFADLFRFADGLDYLLMAIGTAGALVHGSSLPLFLRFFADLVNSFGSNANNVDKMTQEVIKLGNFIHYMATFVSGFVVGFTAVWQLALVTLCVVPLIAVIGGIHTTTLAKLSVKTQDALSQAGNISEQTIAQIRVVLAFVGESRALQAYSSALRVAQRLGYKSGFAKGMGLGATYFTVFCCYALLLWYGGYLVRHHHTNGGLAIATMFAVMIGGL